MGCAERKTFEFLPVVLMAASFGASEAMAAEGGQYAGPIGGSDIRSAYLPSEGIYFFPFGYFGESSRFAGPHGESSTIYNDINFVFGNVGGGLLAVWPWHPWDVNIASTFEENVVTGCGKIGTRGGVVLQNCATNIVDPYTDLVIVSKYVGLAGAEAPETGRSLPYGLTVAAAISGSIPIADTSTTKPAVGGKGAWIAAPNISATYLTGPNLSFWDGTEISVKLYYETSSTNYLTSYRNGDVFVSDFALTERVGQLQAGLAGTYGAQLTNDQPAGHRPPPFNGNRLKDFQLGPVIAYDVPEWRVSFSAKGLAELYSENRLQINGVILRAAFRIF